MKVLFARLLVVVAVLALAGCTERTGGSPEATRSGSGPVDLAVPVELCPVLSMTPSGGASPPVPSPSSPQPSSSSSPSSSPPSVVEDAEGTEYELDEPFMTIERIEDGRIEFVTGSQWVLNLELTAADGKTFGDWTTEHISEQAAMVLEDEVLFAPTIQSAILDGKVQVSGNYTQSEAQDLLDRIMGRQ